MKKVLFAMAIAGMFGFAACNNNNKTEEPVVDSAAIENTCCEQAEECTDSTATVENVAEETAEQVAQ